MTEIERMWDEAEEDAGHKLINGTLEAQAGYICAMCGSEAAVEKVSGCVQCPTCGNKECGDG